MNILTPIKNFFWRLSIIPVAVVCIGYMILAILLWLPVWVITGTDTLQSGAIAFDYLMDYGDKIVHEKC